MDIKDISNYVSETDKKLCETEIKKQSNDGIIGMYLDMSFFKQIGNNPQIKLSNLNHFLSITINVPEYMWGNSGLTRFFYILRIHNGQVETLETTTNTSISFMTDRFSTYALAYSDEQESGDEKMEIPVDIYFINSNGSRGLPKDCKDTELTIKLIIEEEHKTLTSAKNMIALSSEMKETKTIFPFTKNIEDIAEPGKYSVSASISPQTLEHDIYDASGTIDIVPYQLSVKNNPEIYQINNGETHIRLYIVWSDNFYVNPEPVVYILPEDEIGAYWLKDDGTKEYLLFQTYDICMNYLGNDELCRGNERCFHKEIR